MRPLLGNWVATARDTSQRRVRCTRSFEPLGNGWIELRADWEIGSAVRYREVAIFGALEDGRLGFYSFTSDGKRSTGYLATAADVHPHAVAFEAQMPAGLARALYWPDDSGEGFRFAVESRNKNGWRRFLSHHYQSA